MNRFSHPFKEPGPDHHPLFDHDLDDLFREARLIDDTFDAAGIKRRIEQAVPGMVAPIFVAPADVKARAARAVALFVELAADETFAATDPRLQQLRALLDITQPELLLGHSPLNAA